MAKQTVLIIEDEEDILALVHFNLMKVGYNVECADTGEEGLRKAQASPPDLILLDLMLPEMDGLSVCRELKARSVTAEIPVIMMTAKGEEDDIVAGLELGADDYVTKPFSPKVLMARIKAALRDSGRRAVDTDEDLLRGDLSIRPGRREVSIQGAPVQLTDTEFRVLHFLAGRPGWVFTRYQIVNAVKGEDYIVTERSVDVQIAGLRRKLGDCGDYIETVRGVGYRFRDFS